MLAVYLNFFQCDVKPNELDDLLESNEDVFVLFHDANSLKSKNIISKMDKLVKS